MFGLRRSKAKAGDSKSQKEGTSKPSTTTEQPSTSANQHEEADPNETGLSWESLYADPPGALKSAPSTEKQERVQQKLALCTVCFDFTTENKHTAEKETKRQALTELVHYTNSSQGITDKLQGDLMRMVRENLFRPLPPSRTEMGGESTEAAEPEEEAVAYDPAWSHLQLVYEILLRFIVAKDTDPKQAKKEVDQIFVMHLIELFASEDPRERDYLKTILHRLYGRFMSHRGFIRQQMGASFLRVACEEEAASGIAELLEVLGSIVNGFAVPLKEEHKSFFWKSLMPLHRPRNVCMYHQQLQYCTVQFLTKEPSMSPDALRSVLKNWPRDSSNKEVLFLGELEEIMNCTDTDDFSHVAHQCFRRISLCIESQHFQVAERALFMWNEDHVSDLVSRHRSVAFPALCHALQRSAHSHWNPAVHGLSNNVKSVLRDMDPDLWSSCEQNGSLTNRMREREERVTRIASIGNRVESEC